MHPAQPSFAPKSTQESTEPKVAPTKETSGSDATSAFLLGLARWCVAGYAGLLPLFFVVGLWGSLTLQKVLLSVGAVGAVVIILSLLTLRTKKTVTIVPISLVLFLGIVVSAVVSGLFSPDWQGAFRGSYLETQTVGFWMLLLGVMVMTLVLQQSKKIISVSLMMLLASTTLVTVYITSRLFFGPVLSLGSFGTVTVSPIGNFNDMAVFAGLAIVLSLVSLVQLRLTAYAKILFAGLVAGSLVVLAAVNFFYVWLVVGFVALLTLLYLISQDTLFADQTNKKPANFSKFTLGVVALVCVVSAAFVVVGEYAAGEVQEVFGVEYLEVRPSLGATTNILQSTLQEDLFFGVGPNQFVSSWRDFKDASINQTVFWDTDFEAGSGYIPTMFVNLGLVGMFFIIAFHGWYIWSGLQMLLRPVASDSFWYFVGVVSFVGAVFLWGMSYVYIPGATLLLLAAFLTGISLVAARSLQPERAITITLAATQQRGFVLMAVAIMCISGVMGTWFTLGKQYVAQASFNETEARSADVAVLDQAALASYALYPDDRFLDVRARIAFLEMNQLLSVPEPTEVEQQRFIEVSNQAVTFIEQAILQAPHEPSYYALRAGVFNNLAIAGVPNAIGRATSSVAEAVALDPQNPSYALLLAQMAVNRGDLAETRQALSTALSQKNNFAQALFLLAQLEISEGNVTEAIVTTEAIIRLEPNNPTRYYQLGILESSNGNADRAAQAYRAALAIDPNFANARYLLALIQISEGQVAEALDSLRIVAQSNADNVQLQELIAALEAGEVPAIADASATQVSESTPVVDENGVTSPVVPDSDLLTPLNIVGSDDESTQEVEELDTPESSESEQESEEVEPTSDQSEE